MIKDVSKYLFKRDQKRLNLLYMEDGEGIIAFIEECMALGLGISGGGVNKLSALLAAAKFVNLSSQSIRCVEEKRKKMSMEKTALYKRKRTASSSDLEQQNKKRK